MSTKVLSLNAYVFGTNINTPIPCQIPLGVSSKEIINLLNCTYHANVDADSILLLKYMNGSRAFYAIIDSKSDLDRHTDKKDISLLLYPPKICLTIHAPDGHSAVREFDAKKTSGDIIAGLLHSSFKLQTHLAYSLYRKVGEAFYPMSNIKPIVENDPFLTDVYLRRYFWQKAFIKLSKEPDINFLYSQAREIVYSPDFAYKEYKFIELIAMDLIIHYTTYEQIKKIFKKCKKKQRQKMFPKFIYDSHKNLKNAMKQTKNFEGRGVVDLKKAFVLLCLENQFFGINKYQAKCSPLDAPNDPPKDYILTLDDQLLYLLDPKTSIIIHRLELHRISRYFVSNGRVDFVVINNKRKENGSRSNTKWPIAIKETVSFFEYFTNLIHFVKHENLQKQKKHDHERHKHRKRRNTTGGTLYRSMSISTFKTSSFNFVDRDDMDLTDVDFHPTLELSSNKTLSKITSPDPQTAIDSEAEFEALTEIDALKDNEFLNEVRLAIPEDDRQFGYATSEYEDLKTIPYDPNRSTPEMNEEYDEVLPPEVYLTEVCTLVKKTVNEDALLSETIMFIQSHLPQNQFKQSIIGWHLQCQADSNYQRISCVSRAIIYFVCMNKTIAPLDLFATVNYIHSILLVYGRSQWSGINFVEIARKVDYQLGLVTENYLALSKRISHPIVSILLDCSMKISPNFADLYELTQTIYFALFITCVTVARAFCNVGIANSILQPILDTFPDVIMFDFGKLIELAGPLHQIGRSFERNEEAQKKFFAQPHYSNPQLKSILSIINDLYTASCIIQSPVFAFMSLHSYSLSDLPENPTRTIIEAGNIYSKAKHASVVYWTIDDSKDKCLSKEMSWNASNFFLMFIHASQDMSLVSLCEMYYNRLLDNWNKFNADIIENPLIDKVFDRLDPSSLVIKNLIGSTEKFKSTIGLLCLLSAVRKYKLKALDESYKSLDMKLANDNLKMKELNNLYRIFSILVIDFNKEMTDVQQQLVELGNELMAICVPDEDENSSTFKYDGDPTDESALPPLVPEEKPAESTEKPEESTEPQQSQNENNNENAEDNNEFDIALDLTQTISSLVNSSIDVSPEINTPPTPVNPSDLDERELEDRRLKIKHCRNLLKSLYYVPEVPFMDLSLQQKVFALPVAINERPLPGEIVTQIAPRSAKPCVDVLIKLANVLSRYNISNPKPV